MRRHVTRLETWVLACVVAGALGAVATPAAKPASDEKPKFKAIWEPVNVPEDLDLLSVDFVSPDEGWVAGGRDALDGGVIYHTKDGGKTWELQLGDPQSSDRAFDHLDFVDATHGFAVESTSGGDHRLVCTSDGRTWVPCGTVPQNRTDYYFATAKTGFTDSRDRILRTTDAGKTWQPVYSCRIKTEIGGLTRDAQCQFARIFFPDPSVGYAVSEPLPENSGNVLAKTEDGGSTWTARIILPGDSTKESALWFTDARTGVLRTIDGKMFRTADGGETWTGASGQAEGKPDVSFADARVGLMVVYNTMVYTSNGGATWRSREIGFPATVNDSWLPAPDRAYAVGEHGMVYRYRVVPIEYTAKGMLSAPFIAAR